MDITTLESVDPPITFNNHVAGNEGIAVDNNSNPLRIFFRTPLKVRSHYRGTTTFDFTAGSSVQILDFEQVEFGGERRVCDIRLLLFPSDFLPQNGLGP